MTPTVHPATQLLLTTALALFWLLPMTVWWMMRGQQDANAQRWFQGTVLYSVAVSVFVLAQPAGGPTLLALTSIFSSLSLLLMINSLQGEFLSRPPPLRPLLGWWLIQHAIFVAILFGVGNESAARAFYLTVLSGYEFWLIVLAWRLKARWNSRALDVIILVFVMYAVSNLARVAEWAIYGEAQRLLSFSLLTNLSVVINFLSIVFYSFGYWGFTLEKMQRRLEMSSQELLETATREQEAVIEAALARERQQTLVRLAELGQLAQSGALSASIAHEINQPLASVRLNLESALFELDQQSGNERLKKLLQVAGDDNLRAARIIERIRRLFNTRTPHFELQTVDRVINDAIGLLAGQGRLAAVRVVRQLDAPQPIPMAEGELEHAVLNILDNALQSLEKTEVAEKVITITTGQDAAMTRITVSDNGPGIDPAVRATLFDMAISTRAKGMGLGLWLARYVVERHRGRLTLCDPGGQGAAFVIEFPSSANQVLLAD